MARVKAGYVHTKEEDLENGGREITSLSPSAGHR